MVAPVAKWGTRTGHRFTSGSDVLSLDVLAETNYKATGSGGEGGIASVEFTINGNAQPAITSRSRRRPNYNSTPSPITGTTTMPDFESFGMDLNAADWPNGTITVTAVVTTGAGSTFNMPTLKVYNNKTSDTRPGSKVIYVSPTGSDSNNGLTTGAPVLTMQKAVDLAATSGDLGGAEIVLMAGTHTWSGYYFGLDTSRFTSDHWWFTIRALTGVVIERAGALTNNGDVAWSGGGSDTLYIVPNTGGGQTDSVRVLLLMEGTAKAQRGTLIVATGASTVTQLHTEGGRLTHPSYNSSSNRWTVRSSEYKARLLDHIAGGGAGSGSIEATNVLVEGIDCAFRSYAYVMGCKVKDWTAIQFETTTYCSSLLACNVVCDGQRYDYRVNGLIDCLVNSDVTLEIIDANTVRIQQATSSDVNPLGDFGNPQTGIQLSDLSTYGAELLASDLWGLAFYDDTVLQSGLYGLEVIASGTNGTGPYINVTWPSHGFGGPLELSGWRIKTANRLRESGGGTPYHYIDAVHPDVWQAFSAATDTMFINVRSRDADGARIWASSGSAAWTRVVMVNCGDDSLANISNISPPSLTDCLFFHCTFGALVNFSAISGSGTCEFRRCVFNAVANAPSGITFDGCHFVNPAHVLGTNYRSGSFFNADPSTAPFYLTPLAAEQGLAGGTAIYFSPTYVFPSAGAAASAGAWLDIAELYQAPIGGGGGGDAARAAAVMESQKGAMAFTNATAIVPTNGVLFDATDAIYIGTGGNLLAELSNGQLFIVLNIPDGSFFNGVRLVGVASTGTTCSNIVALYR